MTFIKYHKRSELIFKNRVIEKSQLIIMKQYFKNKANLLQNHEHLNTNEICQGYVSVILEQF